MTWDRSTLWMHGWSRGWPCFQSSEICGSTLWKSAVYSVCFWKSETQIIYLEIKKESNTSVTSASVTGWGHVHELPAGDRAWLSWSQSFFGDAHYLHQLIKSQIHSMFSEKSLTCQYNPHVLLSKNMSNCCFICFHFQTNPQLKISWMFVAFSFSHFQIVCLQV